MQRLWLAPIQWLSHRTVSINGKIQHKKRIDGMITLHIDIINLTKGIP